MGRGVTAIRLELQGSRQGVRLLSKSRRGSGFTLDSKGFDKHTVGAEALKVQVRKILEELLD